MFQGISPPISCGQCSLLDVCGGLEGQVPFHGCYSKCVMEGCRGSDWTCLVCHPERFVRRWQEVGGLRSKLPQDLKGTDGKLPLYIPQILHGYRRAGEVQERHVAVPLRNILGDLGRRGGGRATSIRKNFRLAASTRVLVVGVAPDEVLERFWAHRGVRGYAEALAEMDVEGVTLPNFSAFVDGPRSHTLLNLRRQVRVAEELSKVGVGVIPHLNAQTKQDWGFWGELLEANPSVIGVAKEFQTGNRGRDEGIAALKQLRGLEERLGRCLHPILIGAGRFLNDAENLFKRLTLLDCVPFMRAVKRQELRLDRSSPVWVGVKTARGAPLDDLLNGNILTWADLLKKRSSSIEALSRESHVERRARRWTVRQRAA